MHHQCNIRHYRVNRVVSARGTHPCCLMKNCYTLQALRRIQESHRSTLLRLGSRTCHLSQERLNSPTECNSTPLRMKKKTRTRKNLRLLPRLLLFLRLSHPPLFLLDLLLLSWRPSCRQLRRRSFRLPYSACTDRYSQDLQPLHRNLNYTDIASSAFQRNRPGKPVTASEASSRRSLHSRHIWKACCCLC